MTTYSDDIPLADVIQRSKRPVKRKLKSSDNESELDDSGADEDYVPDKQDINSSDSESCILLRKVQKRKRNVKRKSKRGWNRRHKKMKISISPKTKRPDLAKKIERQNNIAKHA